VRQEDLTERGEVVVLRGACDEAERDGSTTMKRTRTVTLPWVPASLPPTIVHSDVEHPFTPDHVLSCGFCSDLAPSTAVVEVEVEGEVTVRTEVKP
jgi:predicted molibdopterin-dependent oxidoreductase YjgC